MDHTATPAMVGTLLTFLQLWPGNQRAVNTELSSYTWRRSLQAELQDISRMTCRKVHHSWLLLLLLWEWRGCLEFKVVDLTLGRSTVFTMEPSLWPAVSLTTRLCYIKCAKVKII